MFIKTVNAISQKIVLKNDLIKDHYKCDIYNHDVLLHFPNSTNCAVFWV